MPKAEILRSRGFWAELHKTRTRVKARRANPLDEGVFGGEEPLVTFVPGRIAPIIHVRNGNKIYPSCDVRTSRPFTRFYLPVLTPSSVHAERAAAADAALLARLTRPKPQHKEKAAGSSANKSERSKLTKGNSTTDTLSQPARQQDRGRGRPQGPGPQPPWLLPQEKGDGVFQALPGAPVADCQLVVPHASVSSGSGPGGLGGSGMLDELAEGFRLKDQFQEKHPQCGLSVYPSHITLMDRKDRHVGSQVLLQDLERLTAALACSFAVTSIRARVLRDTALFTSAVAALSCDSFLWSWTGEHELPEPPSPPGPDPDDTLAWGTTSWQSATGAPGSAWNTPSPFSWGSNHGGWGQGPWGLPLPRSCWRAG
ncbi:hypothetical protein C8J57DRAFT_1531830 [Mycena rebaudengoi]|nr:hypothetical protein C8J57DRAFT_1531830 [Mycena rebaudengoi]